MAANFDRADILRTWKIFRQPGEVLELRIPKAGRYKTISGYFDNPNAFADAVVGLAEDEMFAGYYFTINQVEPALLARSANKPKKYAESTTTDADILRRRWLPIDLDPVRPAGISSSDEEHGAALDMTREIRAWLISQGWPDNAFIRADSGNGGHLAVRIDLANDETANNLVKSCLEALDFHFSNEKVKVDTSTLNAARIWKIYGTMARKGDSTADRPHRLAKLLDVPETSETVSREHLEALAAMLPTQDASSKESYSRGAGFDPVAYCQAHNLAVHRIKPYNGGTLVELEECIFNPDHKLKACIIGWPNGGRTYTCRHRSCQENHWAEAKAVIEPKIGPEDHEPAKTDAGAKHPREMPKAKAEEHKKSRSLDDFYKQGCIEGGKAEASPKGRLNAMLSMLDAYDPDEKEHRAIMAGVSYGMKHGGEVDPLPYRDLLEEAEAFVAGPETAVDEPTSKGPTVIDAIMALAGVCDGAKSQDGMGFSKFDRETHDALIEKIVADGELSRKEENTAYALAKKYRKQLKKLGIDYDQIGHIARECGAVDNSLAEINDRIPQWIEEHHFKTVSDTKKIYHYEHGVYLDNGETILEALIEAEFPDFTNNKMVSDVIGKVKRRTYTDRDLFNARHVINVKNGLLDLETLQLQPHSPDYLSTTQLDVLYNPAAKAPKIAKFLQEVAQSGDVTLIEEIIGWLLWPDYHIHKAVMLVGPGRNGKGTFLRLIVALLGKKSISNVTLQDLVTDAYAKSDLYGKLVNIGGDLPSKDLSDTSAFRNLTGGDDNRAQEKYRPAFSFRNKAKMLFSANVLPRSQDDTYAFYSRWILLEFLNRFVLDDGTADPDLDEKLQTPEELSGLLNIALAGLKRLRANGWKFSYTKTVEDVEKMYKRNANPVFAFLMDECEAGGATDYIEKSVFFDKFNAYVKKHNLRPMSTTKFGELLKDQTEIPVSTYRPWVDRGDRPMCWSGVKFKTPLTKPAKTPEKGEKTENKTANNGLQSTPSTLGAYSTNTQIENKKKKK
ncbi:MAG: phage/plasmid primase, P4 family [Anaerolineaceae bacterium]|jgi:P4 family phage/plasmid primase-like protien